MDNNVDANNIDIDTIDINIDININDTNKIQIYMKSINLSNFTNYIFSIFDQNFVRFKLDRNNVLMSSYFACKHVFDPNFVNLLSEIHENSNKTSILLIFRSIQKLIDRSIDDTQKLMCDAHCKYIYISSCGCNSLLIGMLIPK